MLKKLKYFFHNLNGCEKDDECKIDQDCPGDQICVPYAGKDSASTIKYRCDDPQ